MLSFACPSQTIGHNCCMPITVLELTAIRHLPVPWISHIEGYKQQSMYELVKQHFYRLQAFIKY